MKKKKNKPTNKAKSVVDSQVVLQKGKRNWERTVCGNIILDCKNFYISYRDNTAVFGSFFVGDDDDCGETALCFDGKYKILNGDFRKEYEKIVDEGLDKCLEFYESKKTENASCWSD